jgi:hypothetical protein
MASTPSVGIDPIIAEARERWQRCDEHEEKQRKRILAAKEFRAGNQWDPDIISARQGKNALQGVAAQPARPCLTIDRLSQPVRQVSNQIKTANFAIDVTPEGHGADDDTAEIYKGYLRRVQNQARDESPIEWAADGAIEAGLGWFRLRTDYVDHAPSPDAGVEAFDQEPCLERITNSLSVYCDPSANKPTRSDALFMFVTEDLARDEFKDRWPWADSRGLDDFMSSGDPKMKSWVSQDIIRIAEYWRVTFTEETWVALEDGSIREIPHKDGKRIKPPKDVGGVAVDSWRVVRRPTVEGWKINACEILEELPWVGSRIPLIPVLGEELNVDGTIVLRGIVSEGMDPQRMVNWTYSEGIAILSLATKSDITVPADAVAAYADIWQTRNVYNHAYMPYDQYDASGRELRPPIREQGEPANLQAAVELMRISEEGIKATTGIYDAGLGNTNTKERSGRALQALQGQSDLSNSNYGASVQRALIYAGEMILEILPKIVRPGQVLHVLGQDDVSEKVIVGQHFVVQAGTPIPISPEEAAQMPPGVAQFYDLSKGRYAVAVKVGKASATKREEGAAALGELIPHLPPEMAAVATPDYVEQLDFEGSHGIAEKLRRALPPQLQDKPEDGSIPPQVQAQMQAMQGQLQEAQQKIAVDGAKEEVKQKGMLQKAQIDADVEKFKADLQIKLQAMKDATSIEVARISAKAQHIDTIAGMTEEAIALDHQAEQAQHDRVHEVQMVRQEHKQALEQAAAGVAGESALASQGHEQAMEQGEQGHAQALEQTEQAAELAPKPQAGE